MDQVEHVKKLREEYERALDAAESRRSAYHDAVLELYRGGIPLREIAKELGLSHQRVHQIVSGEPPRRSKVPRAAGGAAGVVLVLAAATFGALRLAHAPPFAHRANTPPHLSVAFRNRKGFMPGGAVFRRKHEVLVRTTPVGRVSIWRAPERVLPSGGCSWLQLGLNGLGGTCWGAGGRGLPEVVYDFLSFGSRVGPRGPAGPSAQRPSRQFLVIWGRTGPGVDRLTLLFRDGERMSVPTRGGVFLISDRVLQSRLRSGNRPAFLVATDAQGHVVDRRPVRLDRAASF